MKIIGFNIWEMNPQNVAAFIHRVRTEPCDRVVFFAQHEWEFYRGLYYDMIVDAALESGHKLDVITGAYKINVGYVPRLQDINLYYWGTYWFNLTYKSSLLDAGSTARIIDLDDVSEYKYHFISMNNNVHPWRCRMMDLLYKSGIMDKGAISWLNSQYGGNYIWRFWTPEVMRLDDFPNEGTGQYSPPPHYYESFAQLISESPNERGLIFSEKTCLPLLLGKPFLCATTVHHHACLKELGFEWYTEIFDYSFDNEWDEERRYKMIIENFVKLCKIDKQDLKYLHADIKEKIDHNKRLARKIATDFSLYPKIAQDVVDIFYETGGHEQIDKNLLHVHDTISGINLLGNSIKTIDPL